MSTESGSYEIKFDTDFIFKAGLAIFLLLGICFLSIKVYKGLAEKQTYTVQERVVDEDDADGDDDEDDDSEKEKKRRWLKDKEADDEEEEESSKVKAEEK